MDITPAPSAESRRKIHRGEISDEEIQDYLNSIKGTLDAELNEFQRQLDEWRADQGE